MYKFRVVLKLCLQASLITIFSYVFYYVILHSFLFLLKGLLK